MIVAAHRFPRRVTRSARKNVYYVSACVVAVNTAVPHSFSRFLLFESVWLATQIDYVSVRVSSHLAQITYLWIRSFFLCVCNTTIQEINWRREECGFDASRCGYTTGSQPLQTLTNKATANNFVSHSCCRCRAIEEFRFGSLWSFPCNICVMAPIILVH